jgi:cell division septation protein DedD
VLARESQIIAAAAQGKDIPEHLLHPDTPKVLLASTPVEAPVPERKPVRPAAPQAATLAIAGAGSVSVPARIELPESFSEMLGGTGKGEEISSGLYIQLAAFRDPGNADQARNQARALGPATIYKADLTTGTFYRLRLGPYTTQQEADRHLAQAVQAGYPSARIVID